MKYARLTFRRPGQETHRERGATTVEYALVITFVVLLLLTVTLAFVNPGRDLNDASDSSEDNVLPKAYKAVSDKVRDFQTIPDPVDE